MAANRFIYDVLRDVLNLFEFKVYSYNPVKGFSAVNRSHLAPSFKILYTLDRINLKGLI